MPIIVKSPKAKSDLVEIWNYIADDSEIRADAFIGYPLKAGQSAYVDVAVGWANGSIVNPTLMPSSMGCEKHSAQPTPLLVPS